MTSYPKTLNARLDNLIDFNTNWGSSPFVDIQASNNSCAAGYDPIIISKWPGMMAGCYCKQVLNIGDTLEANSCAKNQTLVGCTSINEKPALNMTKY